MIVLLQHFFTARRRYASALYATALRLSQVGVLITRLNISPLKQDHTIAQGLEFSDAIELSEISPRSHSPMAPNAGGVR